jgi:hypothetical protein
MGGCTSKDKTVAENEGCVKYIFSSSFFSSLSTNDDTQKWKRERERERDEFSASVLENFLPQKTFFLSFSLPISNIFPENYFVRK